MEIELQSIKKILNKKLATATNQFPGNYFFTTSTDMFSSPDTAACYNLKTSLSQIKDYFLPRNSLYSIHIRKLPVNSLKYLYIYIRWIINILDLESLKEEIYTFKITFDVCLFKAKTLLKSLFTYNCKNIFVQYSEKTNLSLELDNKTKLSA